MYPYFAKGLVGSLKSSILVNFSDEDNSTNNLFLQIVNALSKVGRHKTNKNPVPFEHLSLYFASYIFSRNLKI